MVKNIIRYLAHTLHDNLTYHRRKEKPHNMGCEYSDSSYANSVCDCRSFSRSVILFAGCPIAWTCAQQGVVALSITEGEYIALTSAAQSLGWSQSLLVKMRITVRNGD